MANEFDFFQLNNGNIGDDWVFSKQPTTVGGRTMVAEGAAHRAPHMKISNFNAMYRGERMSGDYTRTVLTTDRLENEKKEVGVGFGTDPGWYNYNPYVWGSTVKKVLDDQAYKMGMSHNTGYAVDQPRLDVSDKKEAGASGMVSFKNYPKEGYNSFGKKGDKAIEWAGNSWLRMPA